ncbi:MAG: 3,8-cyclase, partial [Acidobacteriaceae bacterium]|nr:3,8-cyclase [Acidobacteriaceae bacterium]
MSTVSTQEISLERSHPPLSVGADDGTRRLIDRFGRTITDLRVSVTDRCNYRCVYCRTGNEGAQYSELSLEEYLRMIRIFVDLGIEKVRLTGGEPLLRSGLAELVGEIAKLRTRFRPDGSLIEREKIDGTPSAADGGHGLDIAVTTNGHLL